MMERKDIYLASKPRYEILDGLRGVAKTSSIHIDYKNLPK